MMANNEIIEFIAIMQRVIEAGPDLGEAEWAAAQGPPQKGVPTNFEYTFWLCIITYINRKANNVNVNSSLSLLARTHRYSRLFEFVGKVSSITIPQ